MYVCIYVFDWLLKLFTHLRVVAVSLHALMMNICTSVKFHTVEHDSVSPLRNEKEKKRETKKEQTLCYIEFTTAGFLALLCSER